MTDVDSRHPGRDEELVERYLLGRLSAPEKAALEAHLPLCQECRELVARETRIAAGIRRAGREELLDRLQKRLRRSQAASPVPWPRIVAIAASVVILAGIGIVRFWLTPGEEEKSSPAIAGQTAVSSAEGESGKGMAVRKPDLAEEKEKRVSPLTDAPPMKSAIPAEADARAEVPPTPAPAPAPAAAVRGRDKDVAGATGLGAESPDSGALIEGEILDAEVNGKLAGMKKERADAAARENTLQNAFLSQQAGGNALDGRLQQQARRRNMVARLQNVNNQLQITLYPDTPFTEDALRNARIEPVGIDSLRVIIDGETILYRIPPRLQQQIPAR